MSTRAAAADGISFSIEVLGCGDGTETLPLLRHGCTVTAVDNAESLARLQAWSRP